MLLAKPGIHTVDSFMVNKGIQLWGFPVHSVSSSLKSSAGDTSQGCAKSNKVIKVKVALKILTIEILSMAIMIRKKGKRF